MVQTKGKRSGVDEIHTEPLSTKICIICLTVLSMAISCAFCGMYWRLWANATGLEPSYDRCLGSLTTREESAAEQELDTDWTMIYALNCFLYLSLSLFSVALLLGAWLWPLRAVGCIGHCFGLVVHIVAIVLTGVMLYSADGSACADRDIPYSGDDDDGGTFSQDAELVEKLFIAQCSLFFFYNCCVHFSTICGNIGHR